MRPKPEAAAMIAKFLARFSSEEMSAVEAKITPKEPPPIPESILATNKSGMNLNITPTTKSTYPIVIHAAENIITGLRPNLSDTSPRIGLAKNCISGNVPKMSPRRM
jgi:hypothetical protein